eukprot:718677-Rhodomonas_salina.8
MVHTAVLELRLQGSPASESNPAAACSSPWLKILDDDLAHTKRTLSGHVRSDAVEPLKLH